MIPAKNHLRKRMLVTSALSAMTLAIPQLANAQTLVRSGDLSSSVDSAGNTGVLTVSDVSAVQTDIEIGASVVIAEWGAFDVTSGDTVNVTIDSGLGLSEATLFNRVIGSSATSLIDGTINAPNVNFWLVNQNGILFDSDASISAQSFFASSADVANQDIFDFYTGSDLVGNGSTTLGFRDPTISAIEPIVSSAGASFVTDGSLAFVGQNLNLNGSFNAQTGEVAFLSATDLDVTFTPGSPLGISVRAGTTVATQIVDGTVQGNSATFGLFTSVGVVGSLLQVDSNVTATSAVATDRGITLLAQASSGSADIQLSGAISTTGTLVSGNTGDFTSTGNITASAFNVGTGGTISTQNLSATEGNLSLNGASISTAALDAGGGGGVILNAPGNITTTSINANEPGATNGFINVDSSGGGALNLGTLTSDGAISLLTGGDLTTGAITTLDSLNTNGTVDPSSITFTGNVEADVINIFSAGLVSALDITASDSNLIIESGSAINVGNLSSANRVTLTAPGDITSGNITDLGASIDVESTAGGALNLGAVSADDSIRLNTTGTLTTGSISTVRGLGNVLIGLSLAPSQVSLTGNLSSVRTLALTSTGSVATANLDAQELSIQGVGDITTGAIRTFEGFSLGAVGGSLTTGDIAVSQLGGDVTLRATGATGDVMTGAITTSGGNVFVSAERNVATGDISTIAGGLPQLASTFVGLHAGGDITAGRVEVSRSFLVDAGADVALDGGDAGDDALISAAGDIRVTGDLSTTGNGADGSVPSFSGVPGSSSFSVASDPNAVDGANISLSSTGGAVVISGLLASANDTTIISPGAFTFDTNGRITGEDIVISTEDIFTNNRGADAIDVTGTWVVYSDNPDANTFGGLDSGNTAVWNSTLATAPASGLTGNRYVFAFQPSLVVSPTDITKTYGEDLTGTLDSNFSVSGLQPGVSGAFLGDTLASILSGTPTITSLGADAAADVAGSPYSLNIGLGSLVASGGYALQTNGVGELTVIPRELLGIANVNSRVYDGTTVATGTVTLNGALDGDDVGTTGTVFAFTDANAGGGILVNLSGTMLTGADAGNYTLNISATALADILQRSLIIAADDISRFVGEADPALTFSVLGDGLVQGDSLTGMLSREAGESPGAFGINIGSLSAGPNYDIQFSSGVLTILQVQEDDLKIDSDVLRSNIIPFTDELVSADVSEHDIVLDLYCLNSSEACEQH